MKKRRQRRCAGGQYIGRPGRSWDAEFWRIETMSGKRARRIHPWHLGMVVVSLAMLAIITFAGSCDMPDPLSQAMDRAVTDVNSIATTGKAVLNSPAAQVIPPDLRLYAVLALNLLTGGAAGYKQWRLAQMGKTTKAIVRGIEAAETQDLSEPATNPSKPVKVAIAAEMRKLGVYDAGNKIVDRLKVS